jgi:uncharacterized OsmC-like protein
MESRNDQVVARAETEYRTDVTANGYALVADEPSNVGGTAAGATPYELLLAALGSCTAITVRMYANNKGWPLESVTVGLHHDKVHAKDCEECETNDNSRIDRITMELELEGPLDATQRRRLLNIAGKCPVHRTLTSTVKIETALT